MLNSAFDDLNQKVSREIDSIVCAMATTVTEMSIPEHQREPLFSSRLRRKIEERFAMMGEAENQSAGRGRETAGIRPQSSPLPPPSSRRDVEAGLGYS